MLRVFKVYKYKQIYYLKKRNRKAFKTTETELNDIAAAAIIGLSNGPQNK